MTNASQNRIRVIAMIIFLLTLIYIFSNFILIPVFLVMDFGLRGFNLGKYSLLAFISSKIVKHIPFQDKPVFFPPKQFAAKIGFFFSFTLLIFYFFNLNSVFIASILAFFAAMEAFLNICMGCIVYNYWQNLTSKISNK